MAVRRGLWNCFALHKVFEVHRLAIEHSVSVFANPVAKDEKVRACGNAQVQLNVAVSEDKSVDLRMRLQIALGKTNKLFFLFALIGRFFAVLSLQATSFGPFKAESHAPARMEGCKEMLADAVMKNFPEQEKASFFGAQSIAVCKVKDAVANFDHFWLSVQRHATFPLQIVAHPKVVVPHKVVYLYARVGQFAELPKETGIAFWHYGAVFEPKVEHIAHQVDGRCVVFDGIQEIDQPPFLCALVADGATAQVGVREEIDFLHTVGESAVVSVNVKMARLGGERGEGDSLFCRFLWCGI